MALLVLPNGKAFTIAVAKNNLIISIKFINGKLVSKKKLNHKTTMERNHLTLLDYNSRCLPILCCLVWHQYLESYLGFNLRMVRIQVDANASFRSWAGDHSWMDFGLVWDIGSELDHHNVQSFLWLVTAIVTAWISSV